jgi:hypothetical protein
MLGVLVGMVAAPGWAVAPGSSVPTSAVCVGRVEAVVASAGGRLSREQARAKVAADSKTTVGSFMGAPEGAEGASAMPSVLPEDLQL